jgi:hypothetical protein
VNSIIKAPVIFITEMAGAWLLAVTIIIAIMTGGKT